MSDFSQLLGTLNNELEKQESLLKLLVRERSAIVHVNQEEMEVIVPEKEKLLEEIRVLVKIRNESIYRIAERVLNKEVVQLDNIIAKCPQSGLRTQLSKAGQEIRRTAHAIEELNEVNGHLIRKTLGLVSSTFSLLSGGGGLEGETYMPSGSMRREEDIPPPVQCRSLNKAV